MPSRTDEEKNIMLALVKQEPEMDCNARVIKYDGAGKAYGDHCGQRAGWGTEHPGKGRCKLHGGASAGAPIVSGLYSKQLNSTLAAEVERIANDPNFLNLYEELAIIKASFGDFMKALEKKMQEDGNWWITTKVTNTSSEEIISPEANLMLKMMETMGKILERIVNAETKMQNTLTIRGIQMILAQIKTNINDHCGTCPVRTNLKRGLNAIKIQTREEPS
jgi:hypothetical protein